MKETTIQLTTQDPVIRAKEIVERLKEIKEQSEAGYLDTCELLYEVAEKKLHQALGYTQFADWVVFGSGLEISARQGFYLLGIHAKSVRLGLTREKLNKCCVSKLKEIFRLDPEQYPDEMVQLIEEAPGMTYEEVKEAVARLKTEEGEEPKIYITLKLNASIKEVVSEAFELARRNYGSVEVQGEPLDISDSMCMELLCQSYIQDPNNQNQST